MTESGQTTRTEEDQPAQGIEARLDAMSAWASKVESQIRGLHSGSQVLVSQIEHLAGSQAEIEQRLTEKVSERTTELVDENVGYKPTAEQQAALYGALAAWQASSKSLPKQSKAQIQTRSGGTVEYKYADIASVSEIAKTAGNSGLAHFHRQVTQDGRPYMRTYLVHQGGGWIFADVPLLTRENAMISGLQQWASACTMARRYGLFMVLGIAAGDEDDDGAMSDSASSRQNAASRRPSMGTAAPSTAHKAP
jgi:hypothetical protein